jgi:hypothetical protein
MAAADNTGFRVDAVRAADRTCWPIRRAFTMKRADMVADHPEQQPSSFGFLVLQLAIALLLIKHTAEATPWLMNPRKWC